MARRGRPRKDGSRPPEITVEQTAAQTVRNYIPTPTLAKFHNDDSSLVRLVFGPVGCLPGHVEFLTPSGWKRLDAYQIGDKVAEWNPVDGSIVYNTDVDYVRLPATQWYTFKSKSSSFSLTCSEEHTMPVVSRVGKRLVHTAKNATELSLLRGQHKLVSTFTVPNRQHRVSDSLIRYAVAVNADGSRVKECPNAIQFGFVKQRKVERLTEILDDLNIEYNIREYKNLPKYRGRSYYCIYIPKSPYTEKSFTGSFWWEMGGDELVTAVNELEFWDGTRKGPSRSLVVFSTSREEDVPFIQYAAAAAGYRSTLAVEQYACRENPLYTIKLIADNSVKHGLWIRKDSTVVNNGEEFAEKFCFTTSTGYFVIRTEGNVLVSGNSGKSVGMVMECLYRALQQEPNKQNVRRSRCAIIRNSYPMLKTTTIQTFTEWIPQTICPIVWSPPITGKLKIDDIGDGTALDFEVLFLALDNPRDIEKLKSLELTFAWINEASGVDKSVLDMLVGRTGRFPPLADAAVTWNGVFMDSNLVDTTHWLYKLFEEEKPEIKFQDGRVRGYTLYKQPPALLYNADKKSYRPNPEAENIDNHALGYDYYLQQIPGKSFDWINVFVLGNYGTVRDGKVVYPAFSEDIHVVKKLVPNQAIPICVGLDFGLNPSAVFTQHTPDGRLLVLRDLTSSNSGIRRFAQERLIPTIGEYYPNSQLVFYGDPAGNQRAQTNERTCFQELRNAGIVVKAAPTNEIRARIEAVDHFLCSLRDGKPAFLIDGEACPTLLRGFRGSYNYKRVVFAGTERYEDKPNKSDDTSHVHDALQYAALVARGVAVKAAKRQVINKPRNYYGASSIGGY